MPLDLGTSPLPTKKRCGRAAALFSTLALLLVGCATLLGCHDAEDQAQKSSSTSSILAPGFELSKDSKDVLYTWVDGSGEFHIAESAQEIPAASRKMVRVIVNGKTPGTAQHVFVSDLSNLEAPFTVSTMERSQWEALGSAAREKKLAELRPQVPQGPSPADLGVDAIVYGADWCKPCHLAEDYLKKKGARVVKKDIEEDSSAASEMSQKLKAAGLAGSSIPVLDVGGTILRGFSTTSIDRALAQAKK